MQRLHLDYQKHPMRHSSAGSSILILGIVASLVLALGFRNLGAQLADLEAGAKQISRSEKSGNTAQQKERAEADQVLEVAFNQLALPWGEVFAAVETAANGEVTLLALEGDGRHKTVRISARTANSNSMLAYLERLKSSGRLSGLHLASHRQETDGSLRFVVQADFAGGA
jgi:Tfp pilus assembly protein PilN